MGTPVDWHAADELLAATRELVEVNRQIAESLATMERLYADEVERNAAQRLKLDAMTPGSACRATSGVSTLPCSYRRPSCS